MLIGAVKGHIASFPKGIRSYGPLVAALDHLILHQRLTTVQGGQIAAKLLKGNVPQEKVAVMKEQLAKCSNESPAVSILRQRWIMFSCM
jgi:hypothetical protein